MANSLLHGDCLDLMKNLPDKSIDMILCDLPYGTTACKWDVIIPFDKLWEQYNRIIKDNGAICLFGSEPFSSLLRTSNLKDYKYDWIWVKNKSTNFLNAKKQPLRNYENISVFKNGSYCPQKTTGHKPVHSFTKHTSDGSTMGKTKLNFSGGGQTDRYPKNVLYFDVVKNDNSNNDKFHPTQKPVELLEYLIKTYTKEDELVLDNCMGSGSTGIACINTNRNFIGIEKEEEYVNIAKARIAGHKKEEAK